MDQILHSPITWIIVAALSEIIALTPLKENSVLEMALRLINQIKPKKS